MVNFGELLFNGINRALTGEVPGEITFNEIYDKVSAGRKITVGIRSELDFNIYTGIPIEAVRDGKHDKKITLSPSLSFNLTEYGGKVREQKTGDVAIEFNTSALHCKIEDITTAFKEHENQARRMFKYVDGKEKAAFDDYLKKSKELFAITQEQII